VTLLTPVPATKPAPIDLTLGSAAGSADDFFVLGYSHEYDDIESARHPEQEQSTFILRYKERVRHVVKILPQRVNDIWQSVEGKTYAAGEARGVLEIGFDVVTEVSIEDVRGTFASIWGSGEEHVFACGHYQPFWLYRRAGRWHRLALPAGTSGLWRVAGLHERDVYAVSDVGEILHFDGHRVSKLDSPTTRWLVAIAPMPDGRVCIGGHQGILLYGDVTGWRTVESGTDQPILNLVPYEEGACFVTPDGLWHFDGRQLPRLLVSQGGRWVSRVGNSLIIVNDERAWLFDGSNLIRLDTTV
jgi:hypothetical protein